MPIRLHHIYTEKDDVTRHRVRKHLAMSIICEGIQDAADVSEDCARTNVRNVSLVHIVAADWTKTISGAVSILITVKAGVNVLSSGTLGVVSPGRVIERSLQRLR